MVQNPELPLSFDGTPEQSPPALPFQERFLGGSPERERALFAGFQRDIKRLQRAVERRGDAGQALRGFHAKALLGVRATLTMTPNLARELRTEEGFLKASASYPVLVRFSSSSHAVKPDRERNGLGIALRIQGEERDYDLLFSDSPASYARDAAEFMLLARMLAGPSFLAPITLLREVGFGTGLRMLRGVLRQTSRRKWGLSRTRFWGKTPMRINAHAVKYQLVPDEGREGPLREGGPDFMRADLIDRIARAPVSYTLYVQRFVDEQRTPIEDHTVEWLESDAPLERIGKLTIARGAFADQPAELEAQIEKLEFNPWNTSAVLRPLGSLNRARKFVYAASAELRNEPQDAGRLDGFADGAERLLLGATRLFALINEHYKPWHELPAALGMLNLIVLRHTMRQQNLHDTDDMVEPLAPAVCPIGARQVDGRGNDARFPRMGSAKRRFGRNVPPSAAPGERDERLLTPSPREISRHLLMRREFVPATSLNLLAAGWIQFQTHDWFAHDLHHGPPVDIALAPDDDWQGARPMRVPMTPRAKRTAFERAHSLPRAHQNEASHWWDGSQLYGASSAAARALRVPNSASLALTPEGLLPLGRDGLPLTGTNQNWWAGLELMHTLFAREHNHLCALLRSHYPRWEEDTIFEKARLINVALMAKIHTVEWTTAILAHPALKLAMDAHWWGILGEGFQRRFGKLGRNEILSGIPGSHRDHFEVPFSLTEEFVAVYRLHPLLPDQLTLRAPRRAGERSIEFSTLAFGGSRALIGEIGLENLAYSFGLAYPGAMCLHNYPRFLINLTAPNEPLRDVGSIDIVRDRERGVPRYNRFRELLGLKRVRSYAELTGNDATLTRELAAIYGEHGIDDVDLLVGSLAEKPPRGFGFSDTAFRVFVLMASRRLKSDRFFTDDFNAETYTAEGLAWVRDNGMRDVLLRNFPGLAPALRGVKNPFAPWQPIS